MIETDSYSVNTLSQRIKREKKLPIISLVSTEALDVIDTHLGIDDFVTPPYDVNEVELRITRLLHRTKSPDSGDLIKCGDLLIDLVRCEVSVSGKLVIITFREYQLLKFLAFIKKNQPTNIYRIYHHSRLHFDTKKIYRYLRYALKLQLMKLDHIGTGFLPAKYYILTPGGESLIQWATKHTPTILLGS